MKVRFVEPEIWPWWNGRPRSWTTEWLIPYWAAQEVAILRVRYSLDGNEFRPFPYPKSWLLI